MIIAHRRGAEQQARIEAQRTGRPHGVAENGDCWEVVPLVYVAPGACVCGARPDGGHLCLTCGLRLSVERRAG